MAKGMGRAKSKVAKAMGVGSYRHHTTAELQLGITKHHEGRVTFPSKMRKEMEAEIKSRGAHVPGPIAKMKGRY